MCESVLLEPLLRGSIQMMNYVDIKRLFGRRFSTDMSAVIGVCRPSLLVYSWTVSRVILRTKLTSDGSIGVQTAERCDYYVLQSSLHSPLKAFGFYGIL